MIILLIFLPTGRQITELNAIKHSQSDVKELIIQDTIDYSNKQHLEKIIDQYKNLPINQQNLFNLIKSLKIQHPEYVLKQAILESGNFKSKLFQSGNNLFGMRKPNRRESFAKKGKILGYASFQSWLYSVADYKLWQGKNRIEGDYTLYLKRRGYAANGIGYSKKLKSISITLN